MSVGAGITPDGDVYLKPSVTSVDEAIERMEELSTYIDATAPRGPLDGLGSFNYLYTVITKRVRDGINTGFFDDRLFLTQLDIAFANRYFDALRADSSGSGAVPRAWRVLLERRSNVRIEPIQFAVAGVNAHVNYDLAIAVVDSCTLLHTVPNSGTQRADYQKVNQIFHEEMQTLRQHYENAVGRGIDGALSPILNRVCDWSVVAARDAAWHTAERLWKLKRSEADETQLIRRMDQKAWLTGALFLTEML